ncbi:hypothetical protein [Curtobacterium oceanosedimentum]|uniref:hypothetical protein n=1 Tax=Curtobacterium oceanosedimentum TaxID=465820 RepID=UPI00339267D7
MSGGTERHRASHPDLEARILQARRHPPVAWNITIATMKPVLATMQSPQSGVPIHQAGSLEDQRHGRQACVSFE